MLNDINTITIILAVALGIFLLLLIILAAVYFSSKSKERKEEWWEIHNGCRMSRCELWLNVRSREKCCRRRIYSIFKYIETFNTNIYTNKNNKLGK